MQTILNHSISDAELEQAVEGLDAGHLLLDMMKEGRGIGLQIAFTAGSKLLLSLRSAVSNARVFSIGGSWKATR